MLTGFEETDKKNKVFENLGWLDLACPGCPDWSPGLSQPRFSKTLVLCFSRPGDTFFFFFFFFCFYKALGILVFLWFWILFHWRYWFSVGFLLWGSQEGSQGQPYPASHLQPASSSQPQSRGSGTQNPAEGVLNHAYPTKEGNTNPEKNGKWRDISTHKLSNHKTEYPI